MSKVTLLPGAPTLKDEPVPSVVELLELLLAEAKAGDVRAVAVVAVRKNDSITTNWRHERHYFALLGGVSRLTSRMNGEDK